MLHLLGNLLLRPYGRQGDALTFFSEHIACALLQYTRRRARAGKNWHWLPGHEPWYIKQLYQAANKKD